VEHSIGQSSGQLDNRLEVRPLRLYWPLGVENFPSDCTIWAIDRFYYLGYWPVRTVGSSGRSPQNLLRCPPFARNRVDAFPGCPTSTPPLHATRERESSLLTTYWSESTEGRNPIYYCNDRGPDADAEHGERECFIDNLLVRIHLIIEMIVVDRPCAMGV